MFLVSLFATAPSAYPMNTPISFTCLLIIYPFPVDRHVPGAFVIMTKLKSQTAVIEAETTKTPAGVPKDHRPAVFVYTQ